MPAKIVTVSRKRRPQRGTPSFPWPIAGCVIVLVAGLIVLRILRKAERAPVTVPEAPKTSSVAAPTQGDVEGGGAAAENTEEADGVATPARGGGPVSVSANGAEDAGAATQPQNADKASAAKTKPEESRRLKHGSEQLLAMIISTSETGVPPLPISADDEESLRRDLLAAITNDIAIFDDEDSRTQEVKERVAEAKRQLGEVLRNGGSVVEAIKEYEAYVNEGAKVRAEVLEKITPEVDAIEDDAEALDYVNTVNEALKKEDIPPIRPDEVGFEDAEGGTAAQ